MTTYDNYCHLWRIMDTISKLRCDLVDCRGIVVQQPPSGAVHVRHNGALLVCFQNGQTAHTGRLTPALKAIAGRLTRQPKAA